MMKASQNKQIRDDQFTDILIKTATFCQRIENGVTLGAFNQYCQMGNISTIFIFINLKLNVNWEIYNNVKN